MDLKLVTITEHKISQYCLRLTTDSYSTFHQNSCNFSLNRAELNLPQPSKKWFGLEGFTGKRGQTLKTTNGLQNNYPFIKAYPFQNLSKTKVVTENNSIGCTVWVWGSLLGCWVAFLCEFGGLRGSKDRLFIVRWQHVICYLNMCVKLGCLLSVQMWCTLHYRHENLFQLSKTTSK